VWGGLVKRNQKKRKGKRWGPKRKERGEGFAPKSLKKENKPCLKKESKKNGAKEKRTSGNKGGGGLLGNSEVPEAP